MAVKTLDISKTVCEQKFCTGCTACISICKHNAISIVDNLDSMDAVIDQERCVECGLCQKVCPQNKPLQFFDPMSFTQGWVLNEDERRKSSSGGFATAILKSFIKNEGIVCSCLINNGKFVFDFALKEEDCDKFRGSKYVKSSPMGVYSKIKEYLIAGKKLLFLGLPCQVAGLKGFVGDILQKNLYTIDLICHGTPSPKLLDNYFKKSFSMPIPDNLRFREKTNYNLYVGENKLVPLGVQDRYLMAFLRCLDYTESCYHCQYARTERISDLTLGDSWGSELSTEEKAKGISLAICVTEKGKELLSMADLYLVDVDRKKAITANKQLMHPSTPSEKRNKFIGKFIKSQNFGKAVAFAFPKACLKQDIKRMVYRLKTKR